MEWVETTGRTLAEAKEAALEQLGVAEGDAEIVVLSEPKPGLFGRLRGEARVRARVRPASPRPKRTPRRRASERRGSGGRQPGKAATVTTPGARAVQASSAAVGVAVQELPVSQTPSEGGERSAKGASAGPSTTQMAEAAGTERNNTCRQPRVVAVGGG